MQLPGMEDAVEVILSSRSSSEVSEFAADLLRGVLKTSESSVLREVMQSLGQLLLEAQDTLDRIEEKLPASSRAGYLVPLEQRIPRDPSKQWQRDEWVDLSVQHHALNGKEPQRDATWVRENESVEQQIQLHSENIDFDVSKGWPRDEAIVLNLLSLRRRPMVDALRQRDDRFSASIHALTDAFLAQKERTRQFDPMPPIYRNLDGLDGLVENEQAWENIERPDRNGFRGVCAMGITKGTCAPDRFHKDGLKAYLPDGSGETVVQASTVVKFESVEGIHGDETEHGAIRIHETAAGFPPNTLFRLVDVAEEGFEGPGGVFVQQRLLTVHATYLRPQLGESQSEGGKMCGGVLSYASRDYFVAGLEDVVGQPMLTMEQEFSRDITWTDWKGAAYSLVEEWRYVQGPAARREGCTPGTRDAANTGKLPADFLEEVNAFIRARRDKGLGILLAEQHAFLSCDEVLALRLYSGPCYQVLNDFLRQVSALRGAIRREVVCSPNRSFAATVGHICGAIRKLAAVVSPEEARQPLYRGVRGQLPPGTWAPDASGLVCAVDAAFMSTSKRRHAPISYMASESNVLWELRPREESDAAFHHGADISMLSQFAEESEVLFPPCTMLVVQKRSSPGPADTRGSAKGDGGAPGVVAQMLASLAVAEDEEHGKRFLAVQVVPHFI